MTSEQITPAQCAAFSGLHSNEILLGVNPTAMHDSLHASYRLHDKRGWQAVHDMIVADIRASLDMGASKRAADLLIVLRRFLSERVAVVVVRNLREPSQVVSFPSAAGPGPAIVAGTIRIILDKTSARRGNRTPHDRATRAELAASSRVVAS